MEGEVTGIEMDNADCQFYWPANRFTTDDEVVDLNELRRQAGIRVRENTEVFTFTLDEMRRVGEDKVHRYNEDIYIPMYADDQSSKVENLDGQLEYFTSKMLRALQVPYSFLLGPEDKKVTLTINEIMFGPINV